MMEYISSKSIELNLHVNIFTILCAKDAESQLWPLSIMDVNRWRLNETTEYGKVTLVLLAWPGKFHMKNSLKKSKWGFIILCGNQQIIATWKRQFGMLHMK